MWVHPKILCEIHFYFYLNLAKNLCPKTPFFHQPHQASLTLLVLYQRALSFQTIRPPNRYKHFFSASFSLALSDLSFALNDPCFVLPKARLSLSSTLFPLSQRRYLDKHSFRMNHQACKAKIESVPYYFESPVLQNKNQIFNKISKITHAICMLSFSIEDRQVVQVWFSCSSG